jgi:NADH dehydrogenase
MGVEVRTGSRVTEIDAVGVKLGDERILTRTVLWAAGVQAAPLGATLGAATDRTGRLIVEQDCSIAGHPEVFCIGDAARFTPAGGEAALPGVSPTAMQQGRFVARQIVNSLSGKAREPFLYVDKGSMATIGRSRAVMQSGSGSLKLSGFFAWLAWLAVHIFYLIDFRNRVIVMFNWAWSYATYGRGSRLITGGRLDPGAPESTSPPGAER